MKIISTGVLILTFISSLQPIGAQTLNWNSLDNSKHILNVGMGWDHSLSFSAGYAYKVSSTRPLFLHANFSIPSGEKILDDFKLKFGGQAVILTTGNFNGSVTINGILRRYENPLVRLVNFGAEMKGTFGYFKPKWFFAGEIGFDKAAVTHFKHSEFYRETLFSAVKDGWFEPATGGNFNYGLQTGYSFKKCDITLNISKVLTQDFKTTPLIPYHLIMGFNYRLP